MGYFVILLIVFFLALISGSFLSFPVVLPFLLSLSLHVPAGVGLPLAFGSGLLMSFFSGTLIGRESLGFLIAMGILYLYSRRFSRHHVLYTVGFSALGSVLYTILVGKQVSAAGIFIDVVLVFVYIPVVTRLRDRYFIDTQILKI